MERLYHIRIPELFKKWRDIEEEVGTEILSSTFQNELYVPSSELNRQFEVAWGIITKDLTETYSDKYLQKVKDLFIASGEQIKEFNKKPIDPEEVRALEASYGIPPEEGLDLSQYILQ